MRHLALSFLLFPLIAGDFDCPASPYSLSSYCYYQFYSTVGGNYSCTIQFTGAVKGVFLSLEMLNFGEDDLVTIFGNDEIIGDSDTPYISLQQYYPDGEVSVQIITTDQSKMEGIFFVCPSDVATIPVTPVSVPYGQEAFILQQFSNPASGYPGNLKLPMKWEVTTDTQVALISAANTTFCPARDCMQMIWIYDGIGENATFIGTAADFQNKLSFSEGMATTLYFVSSDLERFSVTDATNYMAVIANEAKNLEKCASFDVVFYTLIDISNMFFYDFTLNATGTGGGACLTVFNRCYSSYNCDGVNSDDVIQKGNSELYVYAGAPHPNPGEAGLVLQNYTQRNARTMSPQIMDGNARTFYVADDSVHLTFEYTGFIENPYIGREGYIMTPFYPFNSSATNSIEIDFGYNTNPYNITFTVKTTYVPVGAEAYFEVNIDGMLVQKMPFDMNTNVGIPMITAITQPYSSVRIRLFGGSVPNRGTLVTYSIGEGVPYTTTTRQPRTIFPPKTSATLIRSTSTETSITTTSTVPPSLSTTNTLPPKTTTTAIRLTSEKSTATTTKTNNNPPSLSPLQASTEKSTTTPSTDAPSLSPPNTTAAGCFFMVTVFTLFVHFLCI